MFTTKFKPLNQGINHDNPVITQMKKTFFVTGLFLLTLIMESAVQPAFTAKHPSPAYDPGDPAPGKANAWVDSIFQTMSTSEKIAQLIFVRAYSNFDESHIAHVRSLIRDKKVGGLVLSGRTGKTGGTDERIPAVVGNPVVYIH